MDFSPKSVQDVVISSDESRYRLQTLYEGRYPRSRSRSMVITLTGPNGTGKSSLARLLPAALERAYFRKRLSAAEQSQYEYVECTKHDGAIQLERLRRLTSLGPPPGLGRAYIICDEVDNLSPTTQEEIYDLTYNVHIVWIFTSNHRKDIHPKLLDIAIDIFLDAPSEDKLAALANRIATSRGVVLFEREAREIAQQCKHSWRPVISKVESLIAGRISNPLSMKTFCDGKRLDRYGSVTRPRGTEEDYPPRYIDEIIFSSAESHDVVERLVTGVSRAPEDQSMGILIFGRPNSGRKTLASLLPTAIEQCAYGDYDEPGGQLVIRCKSGKEGQSQIVEIENQVRRVCLESVSRSRYVTLIDVEEFSTDAQQDLKSVMNTLGVVFILVTSRISKLDNGVLDRCPHKIFMSFPDETQLRPLVKSILIETISSPSEETVERILSPPPKNYADLFIKSLTAT